MPNTLKMSLILNGVSSKKNFLKQKRRSSPVLRLYPKGLSVLWISWTTLRYTVKKQLLLLLWLYTIQLLHMYNTCNMLSSRNLTLWLNTTTCLLTAGAAYKQKKLP